MKKRLFCFVCVVLMLALSACNAPGKETAAEAMEPDYWPTKGWQTATPESQGMNSELLAGAIDYLAAQDMDIHSLLVIRNGYIVTEAYFAPYKRDSLHDVASVTKSVTSTLMGIAIDQGYIESISSTVGDYIPEASPGIAEISVDNLLTMCTGLNIANQTLQLYQMLSSSDWLGYIMDLGASPWATGNTFQYNSFGPYLCSSMINNAVDMDSLEFADSYLFAPLGIEDYQFSRDPNSGALLGYGDLWISPRDLAKIGYLYLNQGRWDGNRIVSSRWIDDATSPKIRVIQQAMPGVMGYAYCWWIDELGCYSARGRNNQRLDVFPEENLIVVINSGCGWDISSIYDADNRLYEDYILKAVKSDSAIDVNMPAYGALQEKCEQVEVYEPDIFVGGPGKVGEQYLDKVYRFEGNMLGVESIKLSQEDEVYLTLEVSMATFGVPDHMRIETNLGGQWQYSQDGRHGLPLLARLETLNEDKLHLLVNELGNIDVWDITIQFTDSGVSMAFVDKLGQGKDMVLEGTLVE